MKHYRNVSIFLLIFSLILLNNTAIFCQSNNLYVPTNIKTAYNKGTRSLNGMPGPKYWQNSSDYKIKATLDPATRLLKGEESVTYFNNSPDTLKEIVIRLYQDIFKYEAARDFPVSRKVLSDGVKIEKLTVAGKEIDPGDKKTVSRSGTNMVITLPEKLNPNSSASLNISWNFTMPRASFRMGTYGDSTFMVGYWYPQVAVYDDIDGWDKLDYTGTVEFYNDNSNFDVEITEPSGITVWATGELQNADGILTGKYLERYNKARTSQEVVNIIAPGDLEKGGIYEPGKNYTWHFKAAGIPDFAFAMSSHYLWDGVSAVSDKKQGRSTFVSAAYSIDSKDFYKVADIARQTIESLSDDFPGVPFPYPAMTIFNGEGGMEFPMMVNDGSAEEWEGTVHVTSHEITHTYFPFYMGTNERKYAWMDEGWATMIPFDLQASLAQGYDARAQNARGYAVEAGREQDMPIMTLSYQMKWSSYRIASYRKPGAAYDVLRGELGRKKFDGALREFITRWHGKHPMPYDFFFTFNDYMKEDLGWFWKPWFFEKGFPDLAIADAKIENNVLKVLIKNEGNMPVPIVLNITWEDGRKTNIPRSAEVWVNSDSTWIETGTSGNITSIELGDSSIPDVNPANNHFTIKSYGAK
ncbi:MAG: M1 family metallopeptidase [Bacteroidota bacterium]